MTTPNGHGPGYSVNGKGTPPPAFMAADRFDWERIVRRMIVPNHVKLLALVLATYADANGTRVYPSEKRMAAVTNTSTRNVRRILHVIRHELGLLELISRGHGTGGRGSGAASVYRLTIPADLLERATLLDVDGEEHPQLQDTWVSGSSGYLQDIRTSGGPCG